MSLNKSVLIARSNLENDLLYKELASEGFNVIAINLIEYEDLEFDINMILNYEYVILTSKYACRSIVKKKLPRSVNFLIVGLESSNIIKSQIFDSKIRSFNNVDEIIDFITLLDKTKIIYLSGSIISKNIPDIDRHIIYKTKYLKKINEHLINSIKSTQINYVMVFSALSFKKLIHIFKTHDIISYINVSVFICISYNLAQQLKEYSFKSYYVNESSQENMIKLITKYERE